MRPSRQSVPLDSNVESNSLRLKLSGEDGLAA